MRGGGVSHPGTESLRDTTTGCGHIRSATDKVLSPPLWTLGISKNVQSSEFLKLSSGPHSNSGNFPVDQSKDNSQIQVLSPRVLRLKADQVTCHTTLYNAIVKNCIIICKNPITVTMGWDTKQN